METGKELPLSTVDLDKGEEEIVNALQQAAEQKGFFYLINHGISEDLILALFKEMRAFFTLPLEEKMKVLADKNNRGYTPMEEETLDPAVQKKGDTKEGYYIWREEIAVLSQGSSLHGPNRWPSPELLPDWREVMLTYFDHASKLCHRLLPYVALSLGLARDFFDAPGRFDNATLALRLIHYSAEPSDPSKGIFGTGAHSDYGALTLLLADGPGLQICRDKDEKPQRWEEVPAVQGSFIVNFGDMLERWSNHKVRSTLHRVINPGFERYSVPFFFEPNPDCLVECLSSCCGPDNPPRYEPIKAGDYLINKYKQTHANFQEQNS